MLAKYQSECWERSPETASAKERLGPQGNQSHYQFKTSKDCPGCHAPLRTQKQHTNPKISKRKDQKHLIQYHYILIQYSTSLHSTQCTERYIFSNQLLHFGQTGLQMSPETSMDNQGPQKKSRSVGREEIIYTH